MRKAGYGMRKGNRHTVAGLEVTLWGVTIWGVTIRACHLYGIRRRRASGLVGSTRARCGC
eukprot:6854334-Pyramimonas_sp.AAC.1